VGGSPACWRGGDEGFLRVGVKPHTRQQLPPPRSRQDLNTLGKPSIQRALRRLKRHLVFTLTDNASKNFSVICKNLYKYKLKTELESEDGAYVTRKVTAKEVYQSYAHELAAGKCPKSIRDKVRQALRDESFKLPHLYWIPKMHKSPPKEKFIAHRRILRRHDHPSGEGTVFHPEAGER
jgi:hypothetical protein